MGEGTDEGGWRAEEGRRVARACRRRSAGWRGVEAATPGEDGATQEGRKWRSEEPAVLGERDAGGGCSTAAGARLRGGGRRDRLERDEGEESHEESERISDT